MTEPSPARPCPDVEQCTHDPVLVERLDRALLRLRRSVARPDVQSVPIPVLGRAVELAKVLACMAVSELSDEDPSAPVVTVKDVAAALELEHSTASRLLGDAEADGLISRSNDLGDRRRTRVELTDSGRAVVLQSTRIRTWALDAVLAEWDAHDVDAFAGLVERFSATIHDRAELVHEGALRRFQGGAGGDQRG